MTDSLIFDLGNVLFLWNPKNSAEQLCSEDPSINPHIYQITQTPMWNAFDLGHKDIQQLVEHFSTQFPQKHFAAFIQRTQENLALKGQVFLRPLDKKN